MKLVRQLAKSLIARSGYSYYKTQYGPYGINPFVDIRRLSLNIAYPIETFFDVGANIGQTAVQARATFPTASVVCFEPHPKTFAQLGEKLAHEKRADLHNVALGNEVGKATLYEYEGSDLNSLLPNSAYVSRFKPAATSLDVAVTTLDRFCLDHAIDRIDVLKIDTEGFEVPVLRGARDMLSRRAIKFVYAEFNHIAPKAAIGGGSLLELDECLYPAGLRFVASYTDYTFSEGDIFVVCNALFVLSRS